MAKDSLPKAVIMLFPKLADGFDTSMIASITWEIVGGEVIDVTKIQKEVMWKPDVGLYQIRCTLLQNDKNSLVTTREFIIYSPEEVSEDSVISFTYGERTSSGFLTTIKILGSLCVDESVSPGKENPKIIIWGPGRGSEGKSMAITGSGKYRYVKDTLYPNQAYSACVVVQWNGTKENSIWCDTTKCSRSIHWLADKNGDKAFRWTTSPLDSVSDSSLSMIDGASGDTGSLWLMQMKIYGDTVIYIFNPDMNIDSTLSFSFIKDSIITKCSLTDSGSFCFAKFTRTTVKSYESGDGLIHLNYGGENMKKSIFYRSETGDLCHGFVLAKKRE